MDSMLGSIINVPPLLQVTERDSGWDVFSLDYHVDGPISTVLTPDIMNQYLRIFNFLWRLKRAEFTLSQAWARQMTFARSLKTKACLVSFQMAVSEMVYFIYQLQHYILFEVGGREGDR